jgi:uncharacterized membrane protein YjdF
MEFIAELYLFIKKRKIFWLIPVIIILLVFAIVVAGASSSALAPFIYTLF